MPDAHLLSPHDVASNRTRVDLKQGIAARPRAARGHPSNRTRVDLKHAVKDAIKALGFRLLIEPGWT